MNSVYAFEADPVGTGRWQLMASETSLQLSAARKAGQADLELKVGRNTYVYDLSPTEITQKNKATGVKRKLRELPAPAFEYEGDPLGSGKWNKVDAATCEQLHAALVEGKTLLSDVKIGSHVYDYEWSGVAPSDWLAGKQKNKATEAERKVRILWYWAFKDGADWILFDDAACATITEAAMHGKGQVRIKTSSAEYELDLNAKEQQNVKTKFTRLIRAVRPFEADSSGDSDQSGDKGEDVWAASASESSDDDDESREGVLFPNHEHPLRRQTKAGNCCDVEGRHCLLEGTKWTCSAGCDFDVCLECWKEQIHAVEVAGGPPGKPPDGSWLAYDAASLAKCREELLAGNTQLDLEMKGAKYKVDFVAMTQTRLSTGAARQLRLAAARPPTPPGTPGTPGTLAPTGEGHVAEGEQVWFEAGGGAERQLAVVTRVRDGGDAYTVKVGGKRATATRGQVRRVVEVWEFEDPPGSGTWKAVDAAMAKELAANLLAGRSKFRVEIPAARRELLEGPGGGAAGGEMAEYDVDLLQMRQVRVSTSVVRGLRMAAEAHLVSALCKLEDRQRRALDHVMAKARAQHEDALPALFARCGSLNLPEEGVAAALLYLRNTVQIIIHVKAAHLRDPDKLLNASHYRNQFETGTSGGLLNLKRREKWESDLFNGAYDGCQPAVRPKYGVANVVADPRGIRKCRQYGECFLELSPAARRRCTFSGTDSGGIMDDRLATCQHYAHVLLNDFDNAELMAFVLVANRMPLCLASETIKQYKEVQIHGPVQLDTDVVALHVPESENDATLQSFAKRLGLRYYTFGQVLNSCTLKGL